MSSGLVSPFRACSKKSSNCDEALAAAAAAATAKAAKAAKAFRPRQPILGRAFKNEIAKVDQTRKDVGCGQNFVPLFQRPRPFPGRTVARKAIKRWVFRFNVRPKTIDPFAISPTLKRWGKTWTLKKRSIPEWKGAVKKKKSCSVLFFTLVLGSAIMWSSYWIPTYFLRKFRQVFISLFFWMLVFRSHLRYFCSIRSY